MGEGKGLDANPTCSNTLVLVLFPFSRLEDCGAKTLAILAVVYGQRQEAWAPSRICKPFGKKYLENDPDFFDKATQFIASRDS